MKAALFGLLMFAVSPAFAYLEAHFTPPGQSYNLDRRTYVVVSGEGFDGAGSIFAKAALAQVQKIRELHPQAQVALFIARGNDNVPKIEDVMAWAPDAAVTTVSMDLVGFSLLARLNEFTSISGLYIFSHNTPNFGLGLEGNMNGSLPTLITLTL